MPNSNQTELDEWLLQSGGRFCQEMITERLEIEDRKARSIIAKEKSLRWHIRAKSTWLKVGLTLSGLRWVGAYNMKKIQTRHNTLRIARLPNALSGYRILHISDLHFFGDDALLESLLSTLALVDYDLCVLTGDYRFRSFGPIETTVNSVKALRASISTDTLAILGNHDSIHMIPAFENLGISVLLNEHWELSHNGGTMLIVGVDDPSFYGLHDIDRATQGAGDLNNTAALLLAHSPKLYKEASAAGFGAYLCGHTHGGQLCMPSGKPLYQNVGTPTWTVSGAWQHECMSGYTSVGVGASVVNARLFCPPEITVHTLEST